MGFQITARLRAERNRLRRRRVILLVPAVALMLAGPLLAIGLLDCLLPLRETVVFRLVAGLSGAAGLCCVWLLFRLIRRFPSDHDIAKRIEEGIPGLQDSLFCALELESRPAGERNPLHEALLRQVEGRLGQLDLAALAEQGEGSGRREILLWFAALGVFSLAAWLPAAGKVRAYGSDLLRGTSTGLFVRPGDAELPAGSDLIVQAEVLRGPSEPVEIEMIDTRGRWTYNMSPDNAGSFRFELFGVTQPFRYRVSTPQLLSPWFAIQIYQRPEALTPEMVIEPPAYTGSAGRTVTVWEDQLVPQGSRITVRFTGNMPLTAELLGDDASQPVSSRDGHYEVSWVARRAGNWRLRLADSRGRSVETPTYRLDVIEDFSPVIRIQTPEEESSRQDKDDQVPLLAEVTDDYGLARIKLRLNVNGNGWRDLELFVAGEERQRQFTLAHVLKLDGIVDYGDVVTWYIEALDNAEPEANRGRSGVRFLEIRPPNTPPKKSTGGDQGGDKEKEKLSVADLILRAKYLIRETFGLDLVREADLRRERLDELVKTAADLHLETQRRFTKIKNSAAEKNLELGLFEKLFDETVRDLDRVRDLLERGLPEESVEYQQSALAHLVHIEVELEKNQQESKGKGQGKGESQPQQETATEKAEREKDRERQLEELRDLMRDLDHLTQRQEMINRRMERLAAQDKPSTAEMEYQAKKEKELSTDTDSLRTRLRDSLPQAVGATEELSRALEDMERTTRRAEGGSASQALQHGRQARQFLDRARLQLEDLRRQLTGQRLDESLAELRRLQEGQKQVGQETAKMPEGDAGQAGKLADQQSALQNRLEDLMRRLDRAADSLNEENPEAARKLADALRRAEENRVDANMSRAANALRYRKADRAREAQKEAERGLAELGRDLESARSGAGEATPEQLAEQLERLTRDAQELQKSMKGELTPDQQKEARARARENLEEILRRNANPNLRQAGEKLQGLGDSGSSAGDSELRNLLGSTMSVLERQLFDKLMERRVKLGSASGREPPDAYRKLVQEYFKALSEVAE